MNEAEQKVIRDKAEGFLNQVLAQQATQLRELSQRKIPVEKYFEQMHERESRPSRRNSKNMPHAPPLLA